MKGYGIGGASILLGSRSQSLRKDLSWSSVTERRAAFQSTTALRFMLRGCLPRITYAAMIMVFSRPKLLFNGGTNQKSETAVVAQMKCSLHAAIKGTSSVPPQCPS